jgi:hypothetical protein
VACRKSLVDHDAGTSNINGSPVSSDAWPALYAESPLSTRSDAPHSLGRSVMTRIGSHTTSAFCRDGSAREDYSDIGNVRSRFVD